MGYEDTFAVIVAGICPGKKALQSFSRGTFVVQLSLSTGSRQPLYDGIWQLLWLEWFAYLSWSVFGLCLIVGLLSALTLVSHLVPGYPA